MDRNDPVKQRDYDENEQSQSEVVQEGVKIDPLAKEIDAASNDKGAQDDRRDGPLQKPEKGLTYATKELSRQGRSLFN